MVNLRRMQVLIGVERRLSERYEKTFEAATKITTTLTGMPRASGNHSKVEDGAVEMAEINETYREVFEDLAAMRAELEPLLPALLDPDDIGVMRWRYIKGKRPEEIPDIIKMSRRAMFYHLSGAERKLIKMFPDRVTK